ncbi:ankyrin repeat domain-containing protein [Moorena producens]|uniref:ankyrin repeat domain-containing protein n=1 Tax=Moorena producens TaxID=1155739 RepID=UPI003C743A81
MDTEETTQILRQWFESWAKDDIEAVIDGLSETVVFYAPQNEYNQAIPYLGKKVGRQAVAEAFKIRAQTVELLSYDLQQFIVEGNKACIISHTREVCKQTQQIFEVEDAQFIILDEDGKIASWSFYFDPNLEVAAFKGNLDQRLIQAVQDNQLPTVQSLLAIGANLNVRDTESGLTPLMMAANQANVEMVSVLLDSGADLYMLDSCSGTSVLHQACKGGSPEVIRLLFEAGAFVDAVSATRTHQTPLHYALRQGQLSCAEALIRAGANLRFIDGSGQNSREIATDVLGSDHALLELFQPNPAATIFPVS